MRGAIAWFLLTSACAATASAQQPVAIAHYPLRLVDISVLADTVNGLHLLVEPTVHTQQDKAGARPVWLQFHPDSVMEWLNVVTGVFRVPVPNAPREGIQWSPTLNPARGSGALSLGRQRKKGELDKARWLAIADSAEGWRAELTGQEADSLVQLLFAMAVLSRIDTAAAAAPDEKHVDSPVVPVYQPKPEIFGDYGRVLTQYVVGVDGRAEEATLVVLLSSNATLESEARKVIRASRFKPAMRNGAPVRQLVSQMLTWRYGSPPRE